MLKKIVASLLTITLLITAVPAIFVNALADGGHLYSKAQLSAAVERAGTDLNAVGYRAGMQLSDSMNAKQMLGALNSYIEGNLDNVMQEIISAEEYYAEKSELLRSDAGLNAGMNLMREKHSDLMSVWEEANYYKDEIGNYCNIIYLNDFRIREPEIGTTSADIAEYERNIMNADAELKRLTAELNAKYDQWVRVSDSAKLNGSNDMDSDVNGGYSVLFDRMDAPKATAGSGSEFNIIVINDTQIGVQVNAENAEGIAGAKVTITDTSANSTGAKMEGTSDEKGCAVFNMPGSGFMQDENKCYVYDVTVTYPGRQTAQVFHKYAKAGNVLTVTMPYETEQPYFTGISLNGMDVLTGQTTICYTVENDAYTSLEVGLGGGTEGFSGGMLKVSYQAFGGYDSEGKMIGKDALLTTEIKDKIIPSGIQKISLEHDWNRKVIPGSSVNVQLTDKAGKVIIQNNLHVTVENAYVAKPALKESDLIKAGIGGMLGSGNFGVTLGEYVHSGFGLLDNAALNVSLPKVPVIIDCNVDGTVFFMAGESNGTYNHGSWNKKANENWEWEGVLNYNKQVKEDTRKFEERLEDAKKNYTTKLFLNCDLKWSFFAGLSVKIPLPMLQKGDGHERVAAEGYVGAAVKMTYTVVNQGLIGPIPVFIAIELGLGAGVTAALGVEWDSAKSYLPFTPGTNTDISYGSGITIMINLSLALSAGVGLRGLCEIGVRGYGYISVVFRLGNHSAASISVGGDVKIIAKLWIATLELPLWKKSVKAEIVDDDNETTSSKKTTETRLVYAETGEPEAVEPEQLFTAAQGRDLSDVRYYTIAGKTAAFSLDTIDGHSVLTYQFIPEKAGDPSGEKRTFLQFSEERYRNSDDYDYAVCHYYTPDGQEHDDQLAVAILSTDAHETIEVEGQKMSVPKGGRLSVYIVRPEQTGDRREPELKLLYRNNTAWEFAEDEAYPDGVDISCMGYAGKELPLMDAQVVFTDSERGNIYRLKVMFNGDEKHAEETKTMIAAQAKERINAIYSLTDGDAYLMVDTNGDGTSERLEHRILEKDLRPVTIATGDMISADIIRSYANKEMPDGKKSYIHDRIFMADREQIDSASKIRMKSVTVDYVANNPIVSEITDYDVTLNAGERIHIGKIYGNTYIYWFEEITNGDPDGDGVTEKQNALRCIAYDPIYNVVTEPYTLCQFKIPAANGGAAEIKDVDLSANNDSSGTVYVSMGDGDDGVLNGGTIRLQAKPDLKNVLLENGVVESGQSEEIYFRVENMGNISMTKFEVGIYRVESGKRLDTPCARILIDMEHPENSEVHSLDEDSDKLLHAGVYPYAFRMIDGLDELDQKDEHTVTRLMSDGAIVKDTTESSVLLPGQSKVFKAIIRIPEKWESGKTYTFEAQIESMTQSADWQSLLKGSVTMDGQRVALTGESGFDTVTMMNDPKVPGLLMMDKDAPEDADKYAMLGTLDWEKLDTEAEDLELEAALQLVNGEWMVQLKISNRSVEDSSTAGDVIELWSCADKDGEPIFSTKFNAAVAAPYTYNLQIPLTKLMGSRRDLEQVCVRIRGIHQNGREFEEMGDVNNYRELRIPKTMWFIRQPANVTVFEGKPAAFSVEAGPDGRNYEYQWYWRNAGSDDEWIKIDGANASTYRIEKTVMDMNGMEFCCAVRNAEMEIIVSNAALLRVLKLPDTGVGPEGIFAAWIGLVTSLAGLIVCMRIRRKKEY